MQAAHISQGNNTKMSSSQLHSCCVSESLLFTFKNGSKLSDKNVFKGKKKQFASLLGYLNEDNLWHEILLSLLIHTKVCTALIISD